MPATTADKTYLYYACGRYRGDRHMYTCTESFLPVEKINTIVWEWFYGLFSDKAKLNQAVELWQKENNQQVGPKKARLNALDDLIVKAERVVDRLTAAYGRAETEIEARALERERKIAAREWSTLSAERKQLLDELAEVEFTPERLATVHRITQAVQDRLGNADFKSETGSAGYVRF